PQPRETRQEPAGFDGSHRRAQSGPQAAGALRAPIGLRELGDELGTSQALQREFAFELPDVFAFEAHDLERLAYRGVALERFQNASKKRSTPATGSALSARRSARSIWSIIGTATCSRMAK